MHTFFSMGMVHGTTHLYAGEEAAASGVCAALRPEDLMTSTHRGHGHCISKGIDLNKMMAELLGKEQVIAREKAGPCTSRTWSVETWGQTEL